VEDALKPVAAEEITGFSAKLLRVMLDNAPAFLSQLIQGFMFIGPFAH
jgi:hypothetical protein